MKNSKSPNNNKTNLLEGRLADLPNHPDVEDVGVLIYNSSNTAKALQLKAKASATATKSSASARRRSPRLFNVKDDDLKAPPSLDSFPSGHHNHSNRESGGGGLPSDTLKKSKKNGNGPSCTWETKWQNNYRQLVAYKRKHRHCNVPCKYKPNPALGQWVNQTRVKFKKNKISEDHIRLLKKIGFQFDSVLKGVHDEIWMKRYRELVAYKEKHGNCGVPYRPTTSLGYWVKKQRAFMKNDGLSGDHLKLLSDIGFESKGIIKMIRWRKRYDELAAYKKQHGHCNVTLKNNGPFHSWVKNQRRRESRLSDDRRKLLRNIGFNFYTTEKDLVKLTYDEMWMKHYKELVAYKEKHGSCGVPLQCKPNTSLGQWINRQRHFIKADKLSGDRLKLLSDIGVESNMNDERWRKKYEELSAYKKQHGHCNVTLTNNKSLSIWCVNQRSRYRELSDEKRKLLCNIGFNVRPADK